MHADDPDQGPSGHVKYAFPDHVQRVYGELCGVDDESGAIYLRTTLDYEKSTGYHLTVTATDHGTPPSLPVSAKVLLVFVEDTLATVSYAFVTFMCLRSHWSQA